MIKFIVFVFISFSLTGCSHLYNRALKQEWGEAHTLQQKRDLLLRLSPSTTPLHKEGLPINAREARKQYLLSGDENDEFLKRLTTSCDIYTARSRCVYDFYVGAIEKNVENKQKIERRKMQSPVKKGDLFYCKASFDLPSGPVDSSHVRVGVKDNVDEVGFMFSSGYEIISPILVTVDSYSGKREGVANDGSIAVHASYDGHSYFIQLFNDTPINRFNGVVVTQTSKMVYAGSISIFDCKKAN